MTANQYLSGGAVLFYALVGLVVLSFVWMARTNRAVPAAAPAASPALPEDAPRLLVNYTSEQMGRITLINDGPGSITSATLGPLKWSEERQMSIIGSVGMLPPHGQSTHMLLFQESPNCATELHGFMRHSTPHDAITTVSVLYEDGRGRKFSRDFRLTSELDGKVTWRPGPVVAME